MALEMKLWDQRAYPRGQVLKVRRQHAMAMRNKTDPPLTGDVVGYSEHPHTDTHYTAREDIIHVTLSENVRISCSDTNMYKIFTFPLSVNHLIPVVETFDASHSSPLPYPSREVLWIY